jgi:polysaccharide biosynthesis protein PslH
VMILGPGNKDLDRIRQALEIVSPQVFAYPLVRGVAPTTRKWIRQSELFMRRRRGTVTPPPLRFSERCDVFATDQNSTHTQTAIESIPGLQHVVYTGAWFTPAVQRLKPQFPHLTWTCDTHDVFFVVDRDSNQEEVRFLYSANRYMRRELDLLSQADTVIAISHSDRESLQGAGCRSEIIVESGSFSHATPERLAAPQGACPVFGFIGSKNRNNDRCLAQIQATWWPAILACHPGATLKIAGSVCLSPVAQALAKAYPGSVELMGFVASLSRYYAGVHAMLSPIAVQGGLNFKSVEALMAGRPLLTNELGSRCLGRGQWGVHVMDEGLSTLPGLLADLLDPVKFLAQSESIQADAVRVFGDDAAYRQLISRLRAPAHA